MKVFQVHCGGVQLWGPNPILGKAGLRKHTLFQGNLTILGTRSGPDSKNIPYFWENLRIPGTQSSPDSKKYPILGKFDKITSYFRETGLSKSTL